MAIVSCRRCGRAQEGLDAPPRPGELGERILAGSCASCFREWEEMEVKVINELRLNFMDPEADRTLQEHLLDFLGLRE